ncbi:MxiN [Salmonella enterica subsp. enterica serovar Enteritidis]|uniref:MxiN domain protein n=3 Tax=Shigella flexneri TaxID=623 RepID=F5P4K8_SHIFL|nr:MxiN [Shigella flexneri]EBW8917208.1 MxiN [Salmonella enterica subsp. enterica serovar Enteritidis]EDX32695.1 MxiN [Shigella dysenteriae 1012]EFF1595297.1 MxiN [Escherichia coli]EFP7504369.1 MxiN [Shigella sonnei]EFW57733.1 MxiN [Shigella flexneri CDC 796-83]EFW8153994.1 MxiN [Shigella dysenteriae]EGK22685.1 mxiN domain protein [Shigella flexneri K-218]EGK31213.1 mxiN domain protein [Shigella flexneri K-227]EGK39649.1 mxiN domain protein [Shigella flexneri K-304]EIQ08782.1 mxiN domain 
MEFSPQDVISGVKIELAEKLTKNDKKYFKELAHKKLRQIAEDLLKENPVND